MLKNKVFHGSFVLYALMTYLIFGFAGGVTLAEMTIATKKNSIPAAQRLATPASRFNQGIFWEVLQDGKTDGYIFGTFHSNDKRVITLPSNVRKKLLRAKSFSMEAFPGVRYFNPHWGFRSIIRDMTLPEGQTLPSLIGEDLYRELEKKLEKLGVKQQRLMHLYPWAVMNELGTHKFAVQENRGPILDHMLYEMAADKAQDLYQVETLEELVAAYYDFPMEAQISLLNDRINAYDDMPIFSERMLEAYLKEDLKKMLQLSVMFISEESIKRGFEMVYLKNVLFERNYVMAHHMLAPLRRENAFIAVGALHLYGEQGVLKLLEDYGYSTKRLSLNI